MASHRTHPDEFVPGAWVTVLANREVHEETCFPFLSQRRSDRSLHGMPMCVIWLDYPYLLVRFLIQGPFGPDVDKTIIDLRKSRLMLLRPEFVAGILGVTLEKLDKVRQTALNVEAQKEETADGWIQPD